MKAVQIKNYSKNIDTTLTDIPKPQISDSEVLIQIKAAAVNPLELLILTGSVKLLQDYPMPLTLGNECSGIVEQAGNKVSGFIPGFSQGPAPKSKEAEIWVKALKGEGELFVTADQAYVVTRILDAIYESNRTGKPVYFD